MNLKGFLAGSQRSGADFYLKLAQLFESNRIIRDTWLAMAHDMELQATSLENLAPAFWRSLKEGSETPFEAGPHSTLRQPIELKENVSLQLCFAATLDLEEPLILRAYVPLIRQLRHEFSDQALEFYIMVKAHVARLSRLIEPFAGDPGLLQRVADLQEQFEREVQAPPAVPAHQKATATGKKSAASPRLAKKNAVLLRPSKSSKRTPAALPLATRAKRVPKLAKTLVRKLEIPRRRARR